MFAARMLSTSMVRFSFVASFALTVSALAAKPADAAYDALTTVNTCDAEVVSISINGKCENVYATAFQTKLFNTDGTPASGIMNTYCVDLADYLHSKERVDLKPISSLDGGHGAYVGSLYANFAADANTSVKEAALRLAIWKTEYDGPGATSNCGHFVIENACRAVFDQAVYYYTHNTQVADLNDKVSYLDVVDGECGQSLIGPAAVPEPASLAMLGMALAVGVGRSVRRRLRSKVA